MKRIVRAGSALLFLVAAMTVERPQAGASSGGARLADASALAVRGGVQAASVDPRLVGSKGTVDIVVGLADAPLTVVQGRNFKKVGGALDAGQQRAYLRQLAQKQDALMGQVRGMGGRELGRVGKALNAVIVSIDAARIQDIAALPGVRSIRPLINYQLDLSETVPYIGASAVQAAGFDGTGVRVAVLDSGVDYTHAFLGGPGTAAAYTAAYGTTTSDPRTTTTDGLFPTAKVIGGNDGGSHKGVAPGASLYAVKVCSAVASSCSGLALLEGMDFALDPNGDGNLSDAVDVVNMSLGNSYGQAEDDLSEASTNAVNFGVVVVASAGNSADRPYIVSSPSTAPGVISVAATMHPLAKMYLLETPTTPPVGSIWQSWSLTPSLVSGTLVYDTTNVNTARGCTNAGGTSPWSGTPHLNQVLLIDRGLCAVSRKVANAGAAGAVAAVIANNVAQAHGDLPPTFSFGGGVQTISGYTITLVDGNTLKTSALGQTATINPANAVSLAGNMASFSSRGPSYSSNAIKPDIGAPGTAIISAEAGTGTGRTPFAGTSASAPVLTGTVALLIEAYPTRTPGEIKSLLMDTTETNIGINPVSLAGVLAPITRIGGGEVRVDRALATKTSAWDNANPVAVSLSFGYHAMSMSAQFVKTVAVRNYGSTTQTYSITPTFRYASDAASGAVTISAPSTITVTAGSTGTFKLKLAVDVTKLPIWTLNGGSRGGDGFRLQGVEFDGYINISNSTDNVHLAWQVLPHRSAAVTPSTATVTLSGG